MKKKMWKMWIVISAAAVACSTLLGKTFAGADVNPHKTDAPPLKAYTTNLYILTNSWTAGPTFLTISNLTYVRLEGGTCVIRVTDAQWNIITNHYREYLKTNAVSFYGCVRWPGIDDRKHHYTPPTDPVPELQTLEPHNSNALQLLTTQVYESRNGIKCPKCGDELFDDLTRLLTSNPPQTPVFCKKCGYSGARF